MDTYQCVACGRTDLTDKTAVVVEGTNDYLCGKVTERPIRNRIDYEASASVMCLNIYITQKTISDGKARLITVGAIQQLKKTNNPQRV